MGLQDLQQARANRPQQCKAGRIIDMLSTVPEKEDEPSDRECFDEWLVEACNVTGMAADLSAVTGCRMSDNALRVHVKGLCRCDGTC